MSDKYLIITILISLIVFSVSQEEKCKEIQCVNYLQNKTCIEPASETHIYMQACSEGEICNILSEIPEEKTTCVAKEAPVYKRYPGMSCTDNNDCFANKCENNICKSIKENEACTSVEECDYGYTCRKLTPESESAVCAKPAAQGEACIEDTDCSLSDGCLNNKCTAYFSVEDGQSIGKIPSFTPFYSFCKSGYANKDGICQTLIKTNPYEECDEYEHACNYEIKGSNQNVVLFDKCQCGYNSLGKKFCALGSGDYNYTRYLGALQDYYFNNPNCHLAERGGDGCIKDIVLGDETVQKKLKKLYSYKLWALSNFKMYETQSCVFGIEFPDYDPKADEPEPEPPKPTSKQCAKYTCQADKAECAVLETPSPDKISVTLSDVCKDKEKCNIGGEPNDVFYRLTNSSFTCGIVTVKERYPGEECTQNSDCVYPIDAKDPIFHQCINGKCSGFAENAKCVKTEECLAGYSCDSESKTCQKQKSAGEDCVDSYECKNNLLCYQKTCQNVLFSLNTGEQISGEGGDHKGKYCRYGVAQNNFCVEIRDNQGEKMIPCNYDDDCEYSYFPEAQGKLTKKCECGYNAEGKGYCRKFHDYKTSEWDQYFKYLKRSYDNDCHSMSRYNCYKEDQDNQNQISRLKNTVIDAHLFEGAVECAQKVLSSNYLTINMSLILLSVFAFIL